jgi:hypothetical protein
VSLVHNAPFFAVSIEGRTGRQPPRNASSSTRTVTIGVSHVTQTTAQRREIPDELSTEMSGLVASNLIELLRERGLLAMDALIDADEELIDGLIQSAVGMRNVRDAFMRARLASS